VQLTAKERRQEPFLRRLCASEDAREGKPMPDASITTGAPTAPNPALEAASFDRYIRWLRDVENFRAELRARGETESFAVIEQFYRAMLGLSDPDSNEADLERQFNEGLRMKLGQVVSDIRLTWRNIERTKPPVPLDCGALDRYFMRAVQLEGEQTTAILEALSRRDIGGIRSIGRRGVAEIDVQLGAANIELERVYRQRGLNPLFRIQTGGNSSLLGGMLGLGR